MSSSVCILRGCERLGGWPQWPVRKMDLTPGHFNFMSLSGHTCVPERVRRPAQIRPVAKNRRRAFADGGAGLGGRFLLACRRLFGSGTTRDGAQLNVPSVSLVVSWEGFLDARAGLSPMLPPNSGFGRPQSQRRGPNKLIENQTRLSTSPFQGW